MLKWLQEGLNQTLPAGVNLYFRAKTDLFNFQCNPDLVRNKIVGEPCKNGKSNPSFPPLPFKQCSPADQVTSGNSLTRQDWLGGWRKVRHQR